MGKGWVRISTVNDTPTDNHSASDKRRKNRISSNLINNTKSLDIDKLKDESKDLYAKRLAEEDFLLAGYEDKRLHSKKAIKEAIKIKKTREKKKPANPSTIVEENETNADCV